jgi:RNA polymerase-binding transcription factor DksA
MLSLPDCVRCGHVTVARYLGSPRRSASPGGTSFLEQIDRAIKAFETDRFGRCDFCGIDIDAVALAEQPWLATCPAHAGRWIS